MISIESKGNFDNTERFLKKMSNGDIFRTLTHYGKAGVIALANATPMDSGMTASSWYFETKVDSSSYAIIWNNDNIVDGVPIAILIQYGHGTGNGGYVQGRDYINPAIRPIFDRIANDVWREVTSV